MHLESLTQAWSEETAAFDSEAWLEDIQPEPAPQVPQADSNGHYSSPALEKLQELVQAQIAPVEALQSLQSLEEHIQQRLDLMRASLEIGMDEADDPLHQNIRAGFLQFALALKLARMGWESGESDLLTEALEVAQEATDALALSFQAFQERAEACLHINCPNCSQANLRGSARCTHCHRELPRVLEFSSAHAQESGTELEMTTPNYDRVIQGLADYQGGRIAAPALARELAEVHQAMLRHAGTVEKDRARGQKLPSGQATQYLRVLDQIEEAIFQSLDALEEMQTFIDEGDSALLRGLEDLQGATRSIIAAYDALQQVGLVRAA